MSYGSSRRRRGLWYGGLTTAAFLAVAVLRLLLGNGLLWR